MELAPPAEGTRSGGSGVAFAWWSHARPWSTCSSSLRLPGEWRRCSSCLLYRLNTGNPLLWIVAALALATRWRWMSVLVLAKPSLLPFASFRVGDRRWWLALAASAFISALFLPMWPDWIRAVLNARGPFSGLLYSLKNVPVMAIPLVAWAGRQKM